MFTLYNLFKFLHISGVIVWLGGMIALAVLNARLAREDDAAAMRLVSRQGAFFGRAVMGPAAVTTLVAGIVLMAYLGSAFTLWLAWGLVGVFGSIAVGAVVMRRAGEELAELAWSGNPDEARVDAARRRLALWGTVNILLLLSTVWAMVFKPTL